MASKFWPHNIWKMVGTIHNLLAYYIMQILKGTLRKQFIKFGWKINGPHTKNKIQFFSADLLFSWYLSIWFEFMKLVRNLLRLKHLNILPGVANCQKIFLCSQFSVLQLHCQHFII
jgi:hypothetical protein